MKKKLLNALISLFLIAGIVGISASIAQAELEVLDYTGIFRLIQQATDLSGYLPLVGGTMTGDLDMGNQDLKIGTGLIGYDGTASKGLSFDSGNEKVVLESGQLIVPAGTNSAPSIGWTDTGFFESVTNRIGISIQGNERYLIAATYFEVNKTSGPRMQVEDASATNPVWVFNNDQPSGVGRAAANQPCMIGNSLEAQRWIPKADTDSDNTDVFLTGVSGFHGTVWVISLTDNTSAKYRISNITVHDDGLDGDHTSTKDTAGHYNFYYETNQYRLQNLVGDNKSISVVFWVLPT